MSEFSISKITEIRVKEAAKLIKDFCKSKQGASACVDCVLHTKNQGCICNGSMPEGWNLNE